MIPLARRNDGSPFGISLHPQSRTSTNKGRANLSEAPGPHSEISCRRQQGLKAIECYEKVAGNRADATQRCIQIEQNSAGRAF